MDVSQQPGLGSSNMSSMKTKWLAAGAIAGFLAASLLPTEPAMAQVVNGSEKFAMIATPTQPGQADAVFVLDYLTGRLVGACVGSNGKFIQALRRNIVGDFNISPDLDPQFVILPAMLNPSGGGGGGTPARGGIYIGELTSGRICLYGFATAVNARQAQQLNDIIPLDQFEFRQASEL